MMTYFEDHYIDVRAAWMAEARAEAAEQNPLRGYCERVYFVRGACRRRSGPHKGQRRARTTHEVELLKFLPSGKCVVVKDVRTPGIDTLADEVFSGMVLPPEVNAAQLFLEYFRQL